MTTKICTKCKTEKPVTEFRFKNKSQNIYQPQCKLCRSQAEKSTWRDDTSHRDRRNAERQVRVQRNRLFFNEYMADKRCEQCGNPDRRVLEFDHLDQSTKKHIISDMWGSTYSIEAIKAEIAKCRILCANCHKIHTYTQLGWNY